MPRAPRTFTSEPTIYDKNMRAAMSQTGSQLRVDVFVTAPTKVIAASLVSSDVASVHDRDLKIASGEAVAALGAAGLEQPGRAIFVRGGGGNRPVWILDPGQPPVAAGELRYGQLSRGSIFVPGTARFCGAGSVVAAADHVWIKHGEHGSCWSGVSGPCTQILSTDDEIQAMLDSGTAAILRAGTVHQR